MVCEPADSVVFTVVVFQVVQTLVLANCGVATVLPSTAIVIGRFTVVPLE